MALIFRMYVPLIHCKIDLRPCRQNLEIIIVFLLANYVTAPTNIFHIHFYVSQLYYSIVPVFLIIIVNKVQAILKLWPLNQ